MYSLIIAALASFCTAFALTPLTRNLAIRFGLLDHPDRKRKIHPRPIPRIGGIPIAIAYLGSFALLFLFSLQAGTVVRDQLSIAWKLLPAAALVFLTGLLDDVIGLKPWQKLLGQLAAASTAFAAGFQFTGISAYHFGIWWTLPATILWLVFCTNAFNLIDGVDGVAAGVGLLATLTVLVTALIHGNAGLALATAPLAGALLGFLRYNFNPATIFLGDCGSLLIGFLLGCFSLLWTAKSVTIIGMTAPIMVLSVPLFDAALAIVRRFLRHRPIFGGDRGHIHHKLLALGHTPRRVSLLIYAVCGIGAGFSILQSAFQERYGSLIAVLFCAAACIGIQRLGFAEFETARRIMRAHTFRRLLNAEIQLNTFRDALAGAATSDQCWEVLRQSYSDFGFIEIKAKLAGRSYSHTTNGHHIANMWSIRIALSGTEYVNLSREFDTQPPPIVAPFADTVGRVLRAKAFDRPEEGWPSARIRAEERLQYQGEQS